MKNKKESNMPDKDGAITVVICAVIVALICAFVAALLKWGNS